ncbi:hypothetical protein [Empedobacter sp. GD03739]|uniref:hypothetical protein n=1 Tax=Empedobacter sp. GD03739 TaxID=2975376 RepID=UPI002447F9D3|nr:hypothetical protein [Empedobacter sp. GD03739]MDH1602594.1 hypothetical protein [Empedobacter sp. GD03739]
MDRRYSEDDILLILNYDTHGNECLTLTDRCQLHQVSNDLHFNRPCTIPDHLKGLIALILTEISHRNFVYVNSHYTLDREKQQLLLIQTF